MCGRYAFFDLEEVYEARKILEDIAETFGKEAADSVKKGEIFPTETAAVLCQAVEGPIPRPLKWGYLLQGGKSPIINARYESLFEKPLFSRSLLHKKCLVPANAFYEWETAGKVKIKHIIGMENKPLFYMCGLYAPFNINGKFEDRFVIITQEANEQMRKLHSRMPMIVPHDLKNVWINETQNVKQLAEVICASERRLSIA